MITRILETQLNDSNKSILLLGPRQTGKSTLLLSLKPDLVINLADETEFFRYSTDSERLLSLIEAQNPQTVLIDEVQRVPSLLNTIQVLIDNSKSRGKKLRFLLSGSSARKLKRGQANLLPGRILSYQLSGLCARENDYNFNFERCLKYGFLPEPFLETNDRLTAKLLSTYSATYLKEEIQAESLARNVSGFSRFLLTMASQSGSITDFSKLATKSKVSRTSAIRFMEILEDTLIAERVPSFGAPASADTIKHPKFYFFDLGVLNGLLNNFIVSPDRIGNLFEHFIYQQIRNSAMAQDEPIEISFFRTRSGVEVDFIVKLRGQIWAIEVKNGDIAKSDLSGLQSFRDYYPQVHRCLAVSPKEQQRKIDDIFICNWIEMLQSMGL
jgi:predicted AAA+ superfamily ATPase